MDIYQVRSELSESYIEDNLVSESLKQAAVLIALFETDNKWNLLFTRRSNAVMDHKGQVSFPGGAVEKSDNSLEDAALREAFEEVGLLPKDVNVIGRMSPQKTISGFIIHPVVAVIPWPYP